MLTIAPEFRPYSALKVELSTLNSCTVAMVGWNVIWLFDGSFRLMPFIMKLIVSSREPALLNPKKPCPRNGTAKPAFCGGVTEPGTRKPISRKWRPFNGISCTVFRSMTAPTDTVAAVITGAAPVTSTTSLLEATRRLKFCCTLLPTSSSTSLATMLCIPAAVTVTR